MESQNHIKILYADNESSTLSKIVSCFQKWNFDSEIARSGFQAWETYLKDSSIGFIIANTHLPEIDGISLCERIRNHEKSNKKDRTYILLLTSVNDTSNITDLIEAGTDDFMMIPFSGIELRARINLGLRMIHLEHSLKRRIIDLESALVHINRLHGLLPICSYCKRIRGEDDLWYQVEAYISSHSDVAFTHSICPECHGRHFTK